MGVLTASPLTSSSVVSVSVGGYIVHGRLPACTDLDFKKSRSNFTLITPTSTLKGYRMHQNRRRCARRCGSKLF